MNQSIFTILQIILSLVLIGLILIQTKGTGLGSTFGGELAFYSTRRGVEKMLFYLTVLVSALFLITSLIRLIL